MGTYSTFCSGPFQTNANLLITYLQRYDIMVWKKKKKKKTKEPGTSVWFWNFIAPCVLSPTVPVFPVIRQGQDKTAHTLLYVCILWDTLNATPENSWDTILKRKHYKSEKIEHFHPLILCPPFSISNKHIIKVMASRYFTSKERQKKKSKEQKGKPQLRNNGSLNK